VKIELAFGRAGIEVDLPAQANATVLRKPAMDASRPAATIVRDALDNPTGTDNLATLAQGAKTACILICDITRPVPNGVFLQTIIRRLTDAGIPATGITVLVATGLHRPNLDEELEEIDFIPLFRSKILSTGIVMSLSTSSAERPDDS